MQVHQAENTPMQKGLDKSFSPYSVLSGISLCSDGYVQEKRHPVNNQIPVPSPDSSSELFSGILPEVQGYDLSPSLLLCPPKKNSHIFSDHCDSGIFDQTAFPVSLKDLFSPVWKFFLIVRAPEQYIPVFCTHGNSLYIRLKHHLLCIIFRCTQSICRVYGIDGSQKSSVSSPNPFAIF